MLHEIEQIPETAAICYEKTRDVRLPTSVPYLGMGSSYFAPLALKFQGVDIQPEPASDYFHYLSGATKKPLGVLISQSGKSSEVLWCRDLFEQTIAIVNDEQSALALHEKNKQTVLMHAGKEKCTSSKTYINTLIALYNGHSIETKPAIEILQHSMSRYAEWGNTAAEIIYKRITQKRLNGIYVLGSGPNLATALMGALGIQESAKLAAIGMTAAQFDHGSKEAAKDAIVISIEAPGPVFARTQNILNTVRKAGATTVQFHEEGLAEHITPVTHIIPLLYLMHFLIKKLYIQEIFTVGGKVTEVNE